tara:strand:+ start:601 stop:810 length:210 start_codon:yes stop_codon:yes gene_type:complete
MNINAKGMMDSVDFLTKESKKILNELNKNGLNDLMTDDQKKQVNDAKKNLNGLGSKDMVKINEVLNKFK